MRNERIVALGTLAAGAAHELGTPLGTMALLVEEMERAPGGEAGSADDLAELKTQIGNCKRIIGEMTAAAGAVRAEGGRLQPANEFLVDVLDKWQLMRPQARFSYRWRGETPAPALVTEQTVSQALINLLNNAADASPESVEVEGACRAGRLFVEILDRGPGLTAEVQERAAEPFFTTKAPGSGFGIGLFLANATVERSGGTVRLFNREGGGVCTEVILPLTGAKA
jgi:two-component system sensor histidine kinase RegB